MDDQRSGPRAARGIDRPAAADGGPASYAIFALARAHRAVAGALLRDLGLHPGQELLIMRLLDRDGQSQSELLDAVGLDHSTVSKALRRMEAAGLVARSRAEHDRRVLLVHLTEQGHALRVPLQDLWKDLESVTTADVDPQRLADFLETADRLHRSLTVGTPSPAD